MTVNGRQLFDEIKELTRMKAFILNTFTDDEAETCQRCNMKELVRCKDCKSKEKDGISEGFHYCNINGLQVTDDWFCADGERKEGE